MGTVGHMSTLSLCGRCSKLYWVPMMAVEVSMCNADTESEINCPD